MRRTNDAKPATAPRSHHCPEAQKEELIVELWQTLRAIDSATDVTRSLDIPNSAAQALKSAAAQPSANELRERIAKSAPSRPAQPPIADSHWPHVSFAFLASTPVLAIVAMIGVGFLADFGIGWYQRRLVTARERAALELRNAAFSGLYVELTRIAYEPDGKSYRATLAMQNLNPAAPLYVMRDPARVLRPDGNELAGGSVALCERGLFAGSQARRREGIFLRISSERQKLGRTDSWLHAHTHPKRHADQPDQRPEGRHCRAQQSLLRLSQAAGLG